MNDFAVTMTTMEEEQKLEAIKNTEEIAKVDPKNAKAYCFCCPPSHIWSKLKSLLKRNYRPPQPLVTRGKPKALSVLVGYNNILYEISCC